MAKKDDPRRRVGAIVHAKVTAVTSPVECSRLFGARAKAKTVTGTVEDMIIDRQKARARTFLDIHFMLTPARPVRKSIQLCNVVVDRSPEDMKAGNAPGFLEYDEIQKLIEQQSWDQQPSVGTEDCDSNHLSFSEEEELPPHSLAQIAHDVEWHRASVSVPIGGRIPKMIWSVRTNMGETIREGAGISTKSQIDYFISMFPMAHLHAMVSLTDKQLKKNKQLPTSAGELFKFFGILVLITRYEFGSRRELWSAVPNNPLLPIANFGKRTGLSRNRFDALFSCIRFSKEKEDGPEISSVKNRWSLVQDFVDAFNMHRSSLVKPSEMLCVDESMSRWYGLGGSWIQKGLPHYVKIDRKPENGCEIQNAACGRSGIMLHFELVSTAEDEEEREFEDSDLHGTAALKRVVKNWAGIPAQFFTTICTLPLRSGRVQIRILLP